jgi:hypothetical protein
MGTAATGLGVGLMGRKDRTMAKRKWWLLLSALLVAASASAQPSACDRDCNPMPARKVWRDADLRKPLPPALRIQPSAETLAGLKARQFDAGFVGELQPQGGVYYPPDPEVVRRLERERRLPLPSWSSQDLGGFYAAQPLYPWWFVVNSGRRFPPYTRPLPSPRPAPGRRK